MHGTTATGKSAVVEALLRGLSEDEGLGLRYATVNSGECITPRHLFETTVARVAEALTWERPTGRCETVSQLEVELARMVDDSPGRFVLVLDGVDRQREAPPMLLPALARLSEVVRAVMPPSLPPPLTDFA